jgi:hypothetical protein
MWLPFHRLDRQHTRVVATVGRALTLAQNFEHNCKWVFMTAAVSQRFERGEFTKLEESFPFSERLINLMLGPAIRQFDSLKLVPSRDIKALEAARDARNFVAHESAVAAVGQWPEKHLAAHRQKLAEQVRLLAQGDALVSRWSYSIQEKDPPPQHWVEGYAEAVTRWVLRGSRSPPPIKLISPAVVRRR